MVEEIRANGWRQGSIVSATAHAEIQNSCPVVLKESDCCTVLSQSCDILHPDLKLEPSVELVVARRLNSPADGNYTHAKNARRLQFHVYERGAPSAYDAQVKNRFFVPRELLAKHTPDKARVVQALELSEIISWVLSRYARHAFPDEFNKRIAVAVERKIRGALRGLPNLTCVYIALSSWEELPSDQDYMVHLLGTLTVDDYENAEVRAEVEAGVAKIAAALDACDGIVVDDFQTQSEASVTLDHLRNLTRWNFDYISLRDPQHQKMGPSGIQ